MKRKSFLTVVIAAGAFASTGGMVFARERIANVEILPRGDRQWMHGRPGACAAATGRQLKWGGYTLEQMVS